MVAIGIGKMESKFTNTVGGKIEFIKLVNFCFCTEYIPMHSRDVHSDFGMGGGDLRVIRDKSGSDLIML